MLIAFADISDVITMRLNPEKSVGESIGILTDIVKEINPDFPVNLSFIDNLNAMKLKNETTLGILANLFGGLAIFISCLGLFALSAYSAAQRTKEIGVRKILGASVNELMRLLSASFIKLVLIAIFVAIPVAYYLMQKWLQGFEVQTALSWWLFLQTALVTLLIAILTVSWQTYRAARANPVDAIKYE